MIRPASPNVPHLIAVASRLRPILDSAVFVGGQVTELMLTQPAAVRVRPTLDVDLVVEVATRPDFRLLEVELERLGLAQDTSDGAPICRWRTPEGIAVDVMPSEVHILGFANRWYPLALERSYRYEITAGTKIRLPEPPVYLGTRWEAFRGRGGGDLLGSHDLEDIIALVAGAVSTSRNANRNDLLDLRGGLGVERIPEIASLLKVQPEIGLRPGVPGKAERRVRCH